jgi:hypothetical protein
MTTDYDSWVRDRLAELDAMQPKLDELPPVIKNLVQGEVNQMHNALVHKTYGDTPETRRAIESTNRRLAAELGRITVAGQP